MVDGAGLDEAVFLAVSAHEVAFGRLVRQDLQLRDQSRHQSLRDLLARRGLLVVVREAEEVADVEDIVFRSHLACGSSQAV